MEQSKIGLCAAAECYATKGLNSYNNHL